MKNTDLHTHSYYSDGLLSPKQLVRLAKKRKIKNLALTDHNSIKGIKEAIEEGKKIGVNVIPAIEIRCNKGEILGYFIDIKNKTLIKETKKINKKIEAKIKDLCNKLNKLGYKISFKELKKKYPKGIINEFYPIYELYLKGYGRMLDTPKIFKKIKTKKIKEIPVVKAIKLIKKANGIPVIAHPWVDITILKEKNIKKYIKTGLKGLEISNGDNLSYIKYKSKRKDTIKIIRKLAKKYNLILTSGSDYHGEKILKQMPGNHILGKNNCDEKIVKKLKNFNPQEYLIILSYFYHNN